MNDQFTGITWGPNPNKATFSASSGVLEAKPNIKGGDYTAIDTKDGFYIIRDLPMFAEVPKGEHNAPEDVKAQRMQQIVDWHTRKYDKESFSAPTHQGHHKVVAFEDPEFLGYHIPKRVGKLMLDGREQDAIFGDVKLKASAFEKVRGGELPYVSPEVDWINWQFSSLAFLNSMPPHFKAANITIGKIIEDPSAKFEVKSTLSKGLFMALNSNQADKKEEATDEKKQKENIAHVKKDEKADTVNDGHNPDKADVENGGHDDAKMCAHCAKKIASMEMAHGSMDKSLSEIHFKMGMPYKGALMQANVATGKADSSAPKEDDKGKPKEGAMKFADDPEARAKFDAQEARTKALEDKLAAKDADEAKKARVTAAFEDMKGYPMTDSAKASVAYFAALGDEPLKKYVESLKAQTPKDPPRTVSEFESSGKEVKVAIAGNDPDIASFQAKGPEAMEGALKYAARFEAMKQDKACKGSKLVQEGRKVYIETMMELDPTGNFGRKAS